MKDKLAEFEYKTQQGNTEGNEDVGEQVVSLFSSEENDVDLVKQKGEWVAFTPENSLASCTCNARESDNSEASSTVSDTPADKDPHSVLLPVILPVDRGYSPVLFLDKDESCRKVLFSLYVCLLIRHAMMEFTSVSLPLPPPSPLFPLPRLLPLHSLPLYSQSHIKRWKPGSEK